MSDVDALVRFLRARLDEEEQAALRWPDDEREWQVVGARRLAYDNGSHENVAAIDVTNEPVMWWERIYVKRDLDGLAEHIARHDPARVLADVAGTRRILARYEGVAAEAAKHAGRLAALESQRRATHPQLLAQAREGAEVFRARLFELELFLKESALRYDDHPDYDESWRP